MHFSEATSRLRLDPLPTYSHRLDSYFTRIVQELQLLHQEHLNGALGEKKELLLACQQKLGIPWNTPDGWSKADNKALLRLQEVPDVDAGDRGDCFSCDNERITIRHVLDEHEATVNELLESINTSVKRSLEKAANGESLCASDASQTGTRDAESEDRQRQLCALEQIAPEAHGIMMSVVAHSPSKAQVFKHGFADSKDGDRRPDLGAREAEALKVHVVKSPSSSGLLDTIALKQRPSSAQLPAKGTSSQQSTGWVKMVVGGKTLHFETASAASYVGDPSLHSSHASSASLALVARRNAVPMALADEDPSVSSLNTSSVTRRSGHTKARPSSSPSYLGVKKSTASASHVGSASAQHHAQMWVPTRGQCALCERRYMRSHLAGVVLMKRIFDMRRKWGMVIHDSKKFSAASSLYAKAQVCMLCREILLYEDEVSLQAFETESKAAPTSLQHTTDGPNPSDTDDIGLMIRNSILHSWHQQPHQEDTHLLEDVAVNKRARQSSTVFDMDARNAVQLDGVRCAHTKEELQPWWEVDLGNYYVVHSVKIWLRDEVSHLYNGSAARSGTVDSASASSDSQLQRKTLLRPMLQSRLRHLGAFPLHISISMKTGVGRDFEDVLTSCVSSHCVEEDVSSPIVWHAPPNSRGRFVRVQAERQAVLHIEKVHVYIASASQRQQRLHESKMRKEALRRQLKRAAFRASIAVYPAVAMSNDTMGVPDKTQDLSPRRHSGTHMTTSRASTLESAQEEVHPHALASTFLDPTQAEKKRMSRLYTRFKTLLDARSKYMVEELSQENRAAKTET